MSPAGLEQLLRFGPNEGPLVLASPALFEEANRTRTFLVRLLGRLAERGIASALPDLPGTGESLVATESVTLGDWRDAFAIIAAELAGTRPVHIVAIRGGALVDTAAVSASRWYFAPLGGEALVRELMRTRAAAGEPALDWREGGPPVAIAGTLLARAMLRSLADADPLADGPLRVVRLASDPAAADRKIEGAPLWRRTEPGDDLTLAEALAADIADWIAACGG